MIKIGTAAYIRLKSRCNSSIGAPKCPVCGKTITLDQADKADYIRTRRGTETYLHTICVYEKKIILGV